MGIEVDLNQKLTPLLDELRDPDLISSVHSVLGTIRRLDEMASSNGLVRDLSQSMGIFIGRYHQFAEEYARSPGKLRHLEEVYSTLVGPYYSAWNRHHNPHVVSGHGKYRHQ